MKAVNTYKTLWDKISTLTSILCIIHCVMLPIVFSTLPLLGVEIIENKHIEIVTIAVATLVGGYAIVKGFVNYHHKINILWLFVIGIIAMIAANGIYNTLIEAIVKVAGAIAIVFAHFKNRKACKHCTTCNNPTNKI